jgi:hypothetical protein
MVKLIVALFICVVAQVEADYCRSTTYPFGLVCTYGCCDSYSYPCCSAPYYSKPVFIAPVVIGCCVALSIICAVLRICLIQRRSVVTVRYRQAAPARRAVPARGAGQATRAAPSVQTVSASQAMQSPSGMGVNQYGGYNNYEPGAPPPYSAVQPKY